jgi:nucleoside transporter
MKTSVRAQLMVMMFIQFFVWGTWYVAMGVYLPKIGFTNSQIGLAYSSTGWAAIVTPFFMGMIADRFFPAQYVLAALNLVGAALLWMAAITTAPTLFLVYLIAYTMCFMPTLSLTSAIAFNQMDSPQKQFPAIRVMGTVAWIAAGVVVSLIYLDGTTGGLRLAFGEAGKTGLQSIVETAWTFKLGAVCALVMGVYALTLPNTPPKLAGKKVMVRDVLGLDALALLKDRSFLVFILSSLLVCIPLSFYYGFAASYLAGGGVKNITAVMSLGQASEFFFMLVIPFFFARLGVKKMLLVGMGAWVLRYLCFGMGNGQGLIALWYVGVLLHGVCYDFFFVTGQIYTDMRAPKELQASAQGLFALATWGIGMTIGTTASGWVADFFSKPGATPEAAKVMDWFGIWMTPAALAFIVFLIFLVFFSEKGLEKKAEADVKA